MEWERLVGRMVDRGEIFPVSDILIKYSRINVWSAFSGLREFKLYHRVISCGLNLFV